ncbi:Cell wall alpha-1,3-glucan synthase ags1, partial [Tulasnella sp. 417]
MAGMLNAHPPPRRRSSSPLTAGLQSLLSLAVLSSLVLIATFLPAANAMRYMDNLTDYNINSNQNAQSVLDYDSVRPSGKYTPSPQNWRALPTYTLLLDKFADGDPTNNDYFKTQFEHDWREVNFRYGGDLKGLEDKLDYIQGMGVGAIYIAGTPFLNMPWQADSYSAIDFSLLDPHWGTIDEWRTFIDAVHAKGMYLIVDFTVGTMGDFIAWKGYENSSAPFSLSEYDAVWKHPKYAPWGIDEYQDFKIANTYNNSCQLPTMWLENGTLYDVGFAGCYASEFDQYGDMEAFGVHPDYERQLSKFASVQDRLREWQPDVMAKIQKFSCMAIKALDFDGIRIDKATQVTIEALSKWTTHTHECAAAVGKTNFFIPGEVTGGNAFGSLYYGRGRMPTQLPAGFVEASKITPKDSQYFLRDVSQISLDAVAFHYSIYRSLSRFLGMDGNLQVAYDVGVNFVSAWNQIFIDNDMINYSTGVVDPRHMYGLSNFDVFRWPSLVNGTQKQMLGTFITSLVMPGIPLLYYGEEQGFYLFDNGASNYLFGRQPMTSNTAWQRHGCYKLGSEQYFNMPLERAVLGCHDDWNSLDHFDPTAAPYRQMAHFMYIRRHYPSLQDGFNLVQRYNNSYLIELPGSNGVPTEAYVPVADWLDPPPALTKFSPGHDARLQAEQGDNNATTVDIAFEFNTAMNCNFITQNMKIEVESSGQGGTPTIRANSVNCQALTGQPLSYLPGDTFSTWRWSGTLDNVPDGIIRLSLTNVTVDGSTTRNTGRTDRLMFRKGSRSNVMVFPHSDYDNSAFAYANGQFTFTHKALGAERFRYSWNYGKNWTDWTAIEAVTTIPESTFDHDENMFWEGAHIIMQYWSTFAASATTVVHADYGYNQPRRVPQLIARGPYNQWGFDKGLINQFDHREDGKWELELMANWPSYIQINVFANDDYFYGDTDGDGVMERLPPNSVAPNYLNMSAPPWPYLSWALIVDDTDLTWRLEPRGQSWIGASMYAMLLAIPLFTAILACLIFRWAFYGIKHNEYGTKPKESYFPILGAVGSVFGKEKGDATPTTEKFADMKPYTGSLASANQGGNEGSLLRIQLEQGSLHEAYAVSTLQYVQFGNTFNLLHAAASFISVHQKSIGVAGVSDKYGKRSWARYPALWTLKHVDSLPNPDPSDIAALDEEKVDVKDIQIDSAAEAQRPEHKRQAQEWAGIKQDPNADLFVFVGRWSKQKGVDLIADILPTILPKRPSIQVICVGPVIDLYGRFAAEKLARLMEMYPDRVYSKPEFTALPPFLFSGADFALIPSRDEPFGLVAVEFGRKGALGVGSRLGGLGLMPGWWFPVESTSTAHMLSQFGKTIKLALKSTEEERAILRARSAVQRFPVVEWRQKTEDFHR